jgi:hypothetical protein
MEPKKHECSAEMRGDGRRVLDALVIALSSSGFRVDRRSESEVELTAPARFGSHYHPIVGASRIVAKASQRRLAITAELGGVDRMRRFLLLFPGIMCLVLVVVLGIVFSVTFGTDHWRVICMPLGAILVIQVVTWSIVGPLASRKFESKTRAALDALATSVATIGADG